MSESIVQPAWFIHNEFVAQMCQVTGLAVELLIPGYVCRLPLDLYVGARIEENLDQSFLLVIEDELVTSISAVSY